MVWGRIEKQFAFGEIYLPQRHGNTELLILLLQYFSVLLCLRGIILLPQAKHPFPLLSLWRNSIINGLGKNEPR
jgi:hypothetical protein